MRKAPVRARERPRNFKRRVPTRSSPRRLMHEWRAVQGDRASLHDLSDEGNSTSAPAVRLAPLKGCLHEWHFSFSGVSGSDFEGGVYHGRFILPATYPAAAPRVQLLTQNGRFSTGQDICLSASSFHQDTWSTHWSLHKLALAVRLHMLTPASEVGGIHRSSLQRRAMAVASRRWSCPHCSTDHSLLIRRCALVDLGDSFGENEQSDIFDETITSGEQEAREEGGKDEEMRDLYENNDNDHEDISNAAEKLTGLADITLSARNSKATKRAKRKDARRIYFKFGGDANETIKSDLHQTKKELHVIDEQDQPSTLGNGRRRIITKLVSLSLRIAVIFIIAALFKALPRSLLNAVDYALQIQSLLV
eukprot:CAMPEP_0171941336 /NCGR_PEP_ID=MMETSP0993-20121228/37779_1 /TAXON_ID=483369 /ORGANISM="non described non described, Strain CCMP2098" /LENGTH=362 /DNA_ID=CAMNT_0012583547 /DNA_START=120 /DNA_END=1208 /DNA_ORIENTATION=+